MRECVNRVPSAILPNVFNVVSGSYNQITAPLLSKHFVGTSTGEFTLRKSRLMSGCKTTRFSVVLLYLSKSSLIGLFENK